MDNKLIIIAGATAVGKTGISVLYAKEKGGEIISADSMQVYKGFDIGTAKIKKQEMQGIRHYLIDELEPDEDFNVYEFKNLAEGYIKKIYASDHLPVIVGGTGFYIQSVLYDIEFGIEENDLSFRKELEEISSKDGGAYIYEMLTRKDPEAAKQIHPNNIKRIIRALEYQYMTGQKISEHNRIQNEKTSPYDFKYLVLNRPRKEIYERIELRVDQMMAEGFVEEVDALLKKGVSKYARPMQGLGYKEVVNHLYGEASLSETISLIKKNTRHFAKRQITWFKREADAIWIDCNDFSSDEETAKYLLENY